MGRSTNGRSASSGRALGFGARLFLALAIALALVGAAGYKLTSDGLYQQQIDNYVRIQRADVKNFERIAHKHAQERIAVREIDELLDGIGRRPGTIEALLIGPDLIVKASNIEALNGTMDFDPNTVAALDSGVTFAGREADPMENTDDFEFTSPVRFPNGRYVLEMRFDNDAFDAQLADVRHILLLVMTLAVVGVASLFYLLGAATPSSCPVARHPGRSDRPLQPPGLRGRACTDRGGGAETKTRSPLPCSTSTTSS